MYIEIETADRRLGVTMHCLSAQEEYDSVTEQAEAIEGDKYSNYLWQSRHVRKFTDKVIDLDTLEEIPIDQLTWHEEAHIDEQYVLNFSLGAKRLMKMAEAIKTESSDDSSDTSKSTS